MVAIALPDGTIHTEDGFCEGEIGFAPRGEHGFGYDPVFVVQGHGGRTMAELSSDVKNKISHRARALVTIQPVLRTLISELESENPRPVAGAGSHQTWSAKPDPRD